MVCERREKSTCKKDANTTYVYFISYIANREERERNEQADAVKKKKEGDFCECTTCTLTCKDVPMCIYNIYSYT